MQNTFWRYFLCRTIASGALAALYATTACAAGELQADSHVQLMIDAGRIGAILNKTTETLDMLTMSAAFGQTPAGLEANDDVFQALRKYVLDYNLIAVQACETHQLSGRFCNGLYLPRWLKDGQDVRHSDAQLRAMVSEVYSHIRPLWSAICEKGKAAGESHACDME